MTKSAIRTSCSNCSEDVVLDLEQDIVTSKVPSNGKRGALHVAAHTATSATSLVTTTC